jgi:hypothetical protein
MAEHLGVAVEKVNLFEEVNTRSRHLAVLNTIGAAVSRSLNLETVLKEAVRKISETLNFDAVWIYELEPEKGVLYRRGQIGPAMKSPKPWPRAMWRVELAVR